MQLLDRQLRNRVGAVFITISYNAEKDFIYNDWSGLLSVENVKEGAMAVLEILRETKSKKVLNDNRNIIGPWDKANDWIAEVWMPEALSLGLEQFAHILSPGVFGALSAEQMLTNAGGKFRMKLFSDEDIALSWLLRTDGA